VKLLQDKGFECTPPLTVSRMIDELVGEKLESQATNSPVFITEHPQVPCPPRSENLFGLAVGPC
jgi:lysyl-tRNA synthetase class II